MDAEETRCITLEKTDLFLRIRRAEFVNDIPHFYECGACGYTSHSRREVIDHQLNDCTKIGYLEDTPFCEYSDKEASN